MLQVWLEYTFAEREEKGKRVLVKRNRFMVRYSGRGLCPRLLGGN
jgi:hypothetical protein